MPAYRHARLCASGTREWQPAMNHKSRAGSLDAVAHLPHAFVLVQHMVCYLPDLLEVVTQVSLV